MQQQHQHVVTNQAILTMPPIHHRLGWPALTSTTLLLHSPLQAT
jgi:hypothetical protein